MGNERQDLRAFGGLCASGALKEHFGRDTVTITCAACGEQVVRDRQDGRRTTVADRRYAVQHVSKAHAPAPLTTPREAELRQQLHALNPRVGVYTEGFARFIEVRAAYNVAAGLA